MAVLIRCFLVLLVMCFAGCGDNDKPRASISDTTAVYSPAEMDDDDKALNEPDQTDIGEWEGEWVDVEEQSMTVGSHDYSAASVGRCTTYTSTRMNSGRRIWKINKPLWKYARYASVRLNNGYYVPRVVLAKANRTRSGFVCRPGHTTANIIAIWAPRGNKSTKVTVCLK